MKLPNFLIIGAAKAGTSSLYYYLKQHPDIYMSPIKETNFLALEGDELCYAGPDQGINKTSITKLEDYQNLFKNVSTESAVGEASPIYLDSQKAIKNAQKYLPGVKLIAILRNPITRAFSSYSHLMRENLETNPFRAALDQEEERINLKWSHLYYYKQKGFYYQYLQRYFQEFDRNNIKVYLFEDLNHHTLDVVQDIFKYLDVDSSFIPNLTRKNVSGIPQNRFIYNLFTKKNILKSNLKPLFPHKIRRNLYDLVTRKTLKPKPEMDLATKEYLLDLYREDILNLQDLLNRDLSHWLSIA
ncbi:MAG: sulfotransferase [Cyanobacteria bacterium J06631_6]